MEKEVEDGADGNGSRIGAGQQVDEEITHDDAIVDKLRVSLLGVDEALEKVGDLRVEGLVLALEAGDEVLEGDPGDVGQVGGANTHDGVLVEEEIEEGHLADGGEAAGSRS